MTRSYRKWIPYEVAALEEWAGTVPTAEIAERLGRSTKSVDHKAKAMGLSSQSRLRALRTSKACQKRSAAKPSSGSSKNWRNGTLPTCKGATQRPANGSKGHVKIL